MAGRKTKKSVVTASEQEQLAQCCKHGDSPQQSRRCHMVLLKLEGHTSPR